MKKVWNTPQVFRLGTEATQSKGTPGVKESTGHVGTGTKIHYKTTKSVTINSSTPIYIGKTSIV